MMNNRILNREDALKELISAKTFDDFKAIAIAMIEIARDSHVKIPYDIIGEALYFKAEKLGFNKFGKYLFQYI